MSILFQRSVLLDDIIGLFEQSGALQLDQTHQGLNCLDFPVDFPLIGLLQLEDLFQVPGVELLFQGFLKTEVLIALSLIDII